MIEHSGDRQNNTLCNIVEYFANGPPSHTQPCKYAFLQPDS